MIIIIVLNSFCRNSTFFLIWIYKFTYEFTNKTFLDKKKKSANFKLHTHTFLRGRVSSWCNGERDGLRNRSTRVRTPVALLRSLSGKYPWERYEPHYPPSYGLNSTTTVLLCEWLWHLITYKGWYAIKQTFLLILLLIILYIRIKYLLFIR